MHVECCTQPPVESVSPTDFVSLANVLDPKQSILMLVWLGALAPVATGNLKM